MLALHIQLKKDLLTNLKLNETTTILQNNNKLILSDVIQFGGCKDNQYSADTYINNKPTGAMSYAFIKTLNNNKNITYKELLFKLRDFMIKNQYDQIPQLSTSRPLNINNTFSL